MIKIACDKKGTHSLQAIVSLISRECEDKLIKDTLDGHVLKLSFVLGHIVDNFLGWTGNSSDSKTYQFDIS